MARPLDTCYDAVLSGLPVHLNLSVAGRRSNTEDPGRLPVDCPRNLGRWEPLDAVPGRTETRAS